MGWGSHNLCERCWFDSPEGGLADGRFRQPTKVLDGGDVCCACGTPTISGIYVRRQAETLLCNGNHTHPEVWSPKIARRVGP